MSFVRADCTTSPESRVHESEVLRIGDLVGGDERGTERRERVARLPEEALAAHALVVARADVVGARSSRRSTRRPARRRRDARRADHHRELALVVGL
jgi:hypothetical protein